MTLVIDRLSKRYGDVVALDEVGFSVAPGEIFGFLGANGAGKTTTMRIVLDILRADSGTVTWRGQPSTELARRTFGYLPEERGLYPRMRVLDQLVFFAGLYGVSEAEARRDALDWLERFRVTDLAGRRADELSKGNQQKIQFIAAVLHDPEVVLMDEPFTGLDPVNVSLLRAAFLELAARGRTLIFSTHQMEVVESLAASIAIIDHGRLVTGGSTREVRRRAGRPVVRLAVEGDVELAWAAGLPGVRASRRNADVTELTVSPGTDPQSILHAALDRGAIVTCFEIADASLEDVFIELVGRPVTGSPPAAPQAVESAA
ncbi:MAG TPA: ATP-binding cassette domain-containing protein [Candidatus Limnocylindrales bacterium]